MEFSFGLVVIAVVIAFFWSPLIEPYFWTPVVVKIAKGLAGNLTLIVPMLVLLALSIGILESIVRNKSGIVIESIKASGYKEGIKAPDDQELGNTFTNTVSDLIETVNRGSTSDSSSAQSVPVDRALLLALGNPSRVFRGVPESKNLDKQLVYSQGSDKGARTLFFPAKPNVESVSVGDVVIPVDYILRPLLRMLGAHPMQVIINLDQSNPQAIITSDDGSFVTKVSDLEARCFDGTMDACQSLMSSKQIPATENSADTKTHFDTLMLERLIRAVWAKFSFNKQNPLDSNQDIFQNFKRFLNPPKINRSQPNDVSWLVTSLLAEGRGMLSPFLKSSEKDIKVAENPQRELAHRAKDKFDAALFLINNQRLEAFQETKDLDVVQTLALLGFMAAFGSEQMALVNEEFAQVHDLDPTLDASIQDMSDRFDRCNLLAKVFPLSNETQTEATKPKQLRLGTQKFSEIHRLASELLEHDKLVSLGSEQNEATKTRLLVNRFVDYQALVQRADLYECRGQYQLANLDTGNPDSLSDETILGRIHQLKEAAKTNPDNAKQIEELKDIEEFATIRDAQRQRDQNRKSLAINAKSKADRTKSSLDILRKIAEKSLNPYTKIKASIQLARDYTFGPFSNYTDFNTTRLDFWHSEQLLDEVFKKIQKLPLNKVVDEVKSLKLFAFEAYNSLYTTFYRYLSEREVASAIQTNKKYKLQSKTIQDCLERNAHKARDEARKLLREKRQQNKLKPSDLVTEALLEESVVKTEQLTLQSSITELPLCLKP